MRLAVLLFFILPFFFSCQVEKRLYRGGFYIAGCERHKNITAQANYPVKRSLVQVQSTTRPPNGIPTFNLDRDPVRHNLVASMPVIRKSAARTMYKPRLSIHSAPNDPSVARGQLRLPDVKWWEWVLGITLSLIGLACFAYVIVLGAETPILIGALLIPCSAAFINSGATGVVTVGSWGLFYILIGLLIPVPRPLTLMILLGTAALLAAIAIGIAADQWNDKRREKNRE